VTAPDRGGDDCAPDDLAAELLRLARPSWFDRSACARPGAPDMFPTTQAGTAAALACCASCEVMVRCRSTAIARGERHGVWGGLDETALRGAVRVHLRRNRRTKET
jgi:WhiB family redox-sensing transcriptional regulator